MRAGTNPPTHPLVSVHQFLIDGEKKVVTALFLLFE